MKPDFKNVNFKTTASAQQYVQRPWTVRPTGNKQMTTKLFMVALLVVATCFASCKKESDPEGTIECRLGLEQCHLLFANRLDDGFPYTHIVDIHINLLWTPPDNFSMNISGYYPEPKLTIDDCLLCGYGTFTSSIISNVGKVKGLGDITKIPSSDSFDNKLSIKAGYGYVIRFPNPIIKDCYVRMYVVGTIRNNSGKIIGFKVKYQHPFKP